MSDAVVVALIGLVSTVISIVLTSRVNAKVKRVQHQVENDHGDIGLRDDLDAKHISSQDLMKTAIRDIGGLRADVRQQREDHSLLDRRVHDLEATQPRKATTA